MSLENLQQPLLQALIDRARESWTYAIFWQYSVDTTAESLLGWGDGYYKGGEDDKLTQSSAAEQEHRKKVLRQLISMISGGAPSSSSDDVGDEEVTDTEWFFLISMTQSFVNGAGLLGQCFFANEAVWIAGQDHLASSNCERARNAQLLGLQTMVCIPWPNGVVELGSTDLIFQFYQYGQDGVVELGPDLINQLRVLFNATNQIEAPPPPNSQRMEKENQSISGTSVIPPLTKESNVPHDFQGQEGDYASEPEFHPEEGDTGIEVTNQIEAPPTPPNSQRMEKENQSISGNIVIPPLTKESNVPYDFQGQEGDYESEPEFHPEEGDTGIGVTNEKKGATRNTTSNVWQGMTRFDKTLDDGTIYIYARCKTCSREFAADPKKNGTTKLRNHLKRCHGSPLYEDISTSQTLLTQDTFGVVSMKFDQKRLERKCVEWIIHAELSFRTVENLKFKEFVNELQPNFKIPNMKSIAKGILELYLEEKEKLKNQLKGVRVSLTIDTWTSVQNINYMVVTAHFVDAQWVLHKRIISFKMITSHRGEDLGRVLDSCMIEWGIQKLFSITLNNASSNDALIDYMKRRLIGRGTLILEGIYLHVRCACHIINLIVRDGIKELGSTVEGIRNCVKFIHSSPARLDAFRGFTTNDSMTNIGMDVVTMWNSTYLMITSAAKYEQVFAKMADDCENFKLYFKEGVWKEVSIGEKVYITREGPPTPEEWKKAASLAHFLQKFYDATITLSGTKYPTSPMILENVLSLQVDILKAMNDDTSDEILRTVAESMSRKFDKYWGNVDKVCPIMFVAQVLDPRVKLEMLDLILPDLDASEEKIKETKVLIKDNLTRLYLTYKGGSTVQRSIQMESETASGSSGVVGGSSETSSGSNYRQRMAIQRKASKSVEITNEVDSYLNDPCEKVDNVLFDLLGWWKNNCTRYPVLSMVVKDVFAIPSSSVASESAFSLGGRVVDPFRASLTPKTVEALVCSSDWLRSQGMLFYKDPTEDGVAIFTELEILEKEAEVETHVEASSSAPSPLGPSPPGPFPPGPFPPGPSSSAPFSTTHSVPPRGGRPPRGGGRISKRARLN